MQSRPIWTALLALCLQACATRSSPPAPTLLSPVLLAPCPPHLQRVLSTWGDLALDYRETLQELRECAARHKALAEAVKPKDTKP